MKMRHLIAALGLSFLPVLASAHSLSIVNNTQIPLSFSVNGQCSAEIGRVFMFEVKNLPEKILNKLCGNFARPCTITAYSSVGCKDQKMGGLTYNAESEFTINGGESQHITVSGTLKSLIYTDVTL